MQVTNTTTLMLRAINQIWTVRYLKTDSAQIRHSISAGRQLMLTIYGDINNTQKVDNCLRRWLKRQAEMHLIPWLQRLGSEYDLSFNKVTIRGQRTLWGSCNSHKNISLNYKLLFLEPALAEHVLLHELCHTKHLNHSKRFWALLTKIDPNTKLHDKAILEFGLSHHLILDQQLA